MHAMFMTYVVHHHTLNHHALVHSEEEGLGV
jgi:hypothetical protein